MLRSFYHDGFGNTRLANTLNAVQSQFFSYTRALIIRMNKRPGKSSLLVERTHPIASAAHDSLTYDGHYVVVTKNIQILQKITQFFGGKILGSIH